MSAPERLLRRLEWHVVRRLDGRLQGGYRTVHRGSGMDVAGLRPYSAEDDPRHIDWNVTARLDEPYVRQFLQDRELTAWLVIDRSASMHFGSRQASDRGLSGSRQASDRGLSGSRQASDRGLSGSRQASDRGRSGSSEQQGKDSVVAELAVSLARLFGNGGNRVGAILYDNRLRRVIPPGTGRTHVLRVAHEVLQPARSTLDGRGTDLAAMLELAAATIRRRSLVFVLSDFIGEGDWASSLGRLAHRHEVVAIRVVDPAELDLPDLGLVLVEDAETGEQIFADTSDPLLRQRFADQVAAREQAMTSGLRQPGVSAFRVSTDADLVSALVGMADHSRRRRA